MKKIKTLAIASLVLLGPIINLSTLHSFNIKQQDNIAVYSDLNDVVINEEELTLALGVIDSETTIGEVASVIEPIIIDQINDQLGTSYTSVDFSFSYTDNWTSLPYTDDTSFLLSKDLGIVVTSTALSGTISFSLYLEIINSQDLASYDISAANISQYIEIHEVNTLTFGEIDSDMEEAVVYFLNYYYVPTPDNFNPYFYTTDIDLTYTDSEGYILTEEDFVNESFNITVSSTNSDKSYGTKTINNINPRVSPNYDASWSWWWTLVIIVFSLLLGGLIIYGTIVYIRKKTTKYKEFKSDKIEDKEGD